MKYLIAAAVAICAAPGAAHALLFKLPVACAMGSACFVQNYVDHQAGTDWKDYRCGHLSHDGHDGTDFRLPSLADMEAGVNVLASADGTVKSTHDNVADVNVNDIDRRLIQGIECGNGVVIEHEDGWSTQYCHMKKGSLQVKPGDEVHAGDVLGQIGLSGLTEFPHLHLTVRHKDEVIDPFTGQPEKAGCGQSGFTQWEDDAAKALAYKPPGLIGGGFTSETPTTRGIMEGKFKDASLPSNAPALLFWVQVYGPREGDVIKMTLTKGEHGEVVANSEAPLDKSKADYMQYIDTKKPESGEYFGTFTLTRTTEKDGPQVLVKYEGKVSVE